PVPLNPCIGVVMCSTNTPTQPISDDLTNLLLELPDPPPGIDTSNTNLLVVSTENSISVANPSWLLSYNKFFCCSTTVTVSLLITSTWFPVGIYSPHSSTTSSPFSSFSYSSSMVFVSITFSTLTFLVSYN